VPFLRYLLIALLGLVVLAVGGVLVAPKFVDWNDYKPEIAKAVREALGRELKIVGDINLAILPTPSVSAKGVSLRNVRGAQNSEMVQLEEIEVKVDISALLERRIAVQSVKLIRPTIALEITETGAASWDIRFPGTGTSAAAPDPASTTGIGETGGPAIDISLESLRIEEATLIYRDARSGLIERIKALSATVTAESLKGPYTVAGSARMRGQPLRFDISTGRWEVGRPLNLKLALTLEDLQSALTFTGQISELTSAAVLTGKLETKIANVASAIEAVTESPAPHALAKPLSLKGAVTAAATVVAVDDLTLRLGDISFAGAINTILAETPKIDLILAAGKIDLDAALAGDPKPPKAAAKKKVGMAKIANAGKPARPSAFSLPGNLTLTFDIAAEAIAFMNGVIRDAALRGELSKSAITIERLSAVLPGNADFSVSGVLQPVNGQAQFDGEVAAKADNFRHVMGWIGATPSRLPANRLRSFSYTSKLRATPKILRVTDIAMQLDASRIVGGMVVELREKPGVGLRLEVDRLNLDAYLPKPANDAKTAGKTSGTSTRPKSGAPKTAAGTAVPGNLLRLLDRVSANLDLQAGQMTYRGNTLREARLDATLMPDEITIRRASIGDFAGLSGTIGGKFGDLRGKPKFDLTFAIEVRQAARFFRFAGTSPPVPPARLGKLSAKGRLTIDSATLGAKTQLTALGGDVSLDGVVRDYLLNPTLAMGISINHPELADLVRVFAPDFRPAARKLGTVALAFRAAGGPAKLRLGDIQGKAGPVAVKGNIEFAQGDRGPKVKMDLATSEILLDLFLPVEGPPKRQGRSRAAKPGGNRRPAGSTRRAGAPRWSRDPIALPIPPAADLEASIRLAALTHGDIQLQAPKLRATIANGRLAVQEFSAGLFGGTIAGKGAVQPRGKTATVAAELSHENIDSRAAVSHFTGHDRVSGPVSARANLAARGLSEADLVATLTGNVSIGGRVQVLLTRKERATIGAANVGGALLSAVLGNKIRELQSLTPFTRLLVALDQAFGRTPARLSGDISIANGVARTRNLTLAGAGHQALTRGEAQLPPWTFASRTELIDRPDLAPLITLDASGPIDDPSRTKLGGRLLRGGASNIRQGVGDRLRQLVPGVPGTRQPSQGTTPRQQPQRKLDPKRLIEGLFKNFGK